MYHSAEIRWFCRGEAEVELRRWIESGDLGAEEPRRTDAYLFLPDCETTGVKVREGRFEIKARTSEPRPVALAGGIDGLRDSWVKWSRQAPDIRALRALLSAPDDDWIYVSKERRLRKFAFVGTTLREVAAAVDFPPQGFQVELSAVRAIAGKYGEGNGAETRLRSAEPWWSLSLEAFGGPEGNEQRVMTAATFLFDGSVPAELGSDASAAYPAWLLRRHAEFAATRDSRGERR